MNDIPTTLKKSCSMVFMKKKLPQVCLCRIYYLRLIILWMPRYNLTALKIIWGLNMRVLSTF